MNHAGIKWYVLIRNIMEFRFVSGLNVDHIMEAIEEDDYDLAMKKFKGALLLWKSTHPRGLAPYQFKVFGFGDYLYT